MPKSRIIALTILGVIVLGGLFMQTPLMQPLRDKAWTAWVRSVAGIFNVGPFTLSDQKQNQLQRLQSENIRLRAQLHDYHRLRGQLGTPSFQDFNVITAAVVARPIDTLRSQYVINKGANSGLILDAPVVIYGSTIIGTIAELHQNTAVVQLLLHPSTSLTVETVAQDDESSVGRGLLQGRHYTSLAVSSIPRDANLHVNQPVVTTAKENLIPHGLTIGTISQILNAENEAYQEAWLALPYNPDKIDAVGVLVAP